MIRSWIARKLGTTRAPVPIGPAAPFYAIGDMHGRLDLLHRLLDQLDPDIPIVCVGDYVDRGEKSADLLRFLREHPRLRCLKGNHEDMMLAFLEEPETHGVHWLRNGGLQTLASFGIAGVTESSKGVALEAARDKLRVAMGVDLVNWLKTIPLFWQSGNVVVVHAGTDPAVAIENQPDRVLLWGHPGFAKTPRSDGVWVVHGHTIVAEPKVEDGRISIDTGAFATGRLTAALIKSDGVAFVST